MFHKAGRDAAGRQSGFGSASAYNSSKPRPSPVGVFEAHGLASPTVYWSFVVTATSLGDPLVGRVLDGRYEILSRLARGGMATVYRAHDRRLTRTVAVKVMHDGLGDDAEFARKFDREARCAATLSNPHVVSVFDQGSEVKRSCCGCARSST